MKFTSLSPRFKKSSKNSPEKFKSVREQTLAEFNGVSLKESSAKYQVNHPARIALPQFFNIPAFKDHELRELALYSPRRLQYLKHDNAIRKKMKDLGLLAEGMKRAKNVKEESRYYFIQGVLMHNVGQYEKAVEYFEKFLRFVLALDDQKSIELALNSIGCEYMYIGNFEKSLEFHQKQLQIMKQLNGFVCHANMGMCEEINGSFKEAYSHYQSMKQFAQMNREEHNYQACDLMLDRVQKKILQNDAFMTQQDSREMSPRKSEKTKMDEVINSTNYDHVKVQRAIESAEQNISSFLKSSVDETGIKTKR